MTGINFTYMMLFNLTFMMLIWFTCMMLLNFDYVDHHLPI